MVPIKNIFSQILFNAAEFCAIYVGKILIIKYFV